MPKEYTAQEAFDICLNAMRERGYEPAAQSNAAGISCMYRAPDGLKCHYGLLLADEDYDYEMEGRLAPYVQAGFDRPVRITGFKEKDEEDFLQLLQFRHDEAANIKRRSKPEIAERYEGSMADFARRFNLNYTPKAA